MILTILACAVIAARADTEAAVALALEEAANGNRPIPFDRDTAGRFVREAWVRWAETQPCPKPSWLVPYDELDDADKEADRQIGEALARWTLIHDAARASLAPPSGIAKLAELRNAAQSANQHWLDKLDAEAERDTLAAEVARLRERERVLSDFIADFAAAKIDALRYQPAYGESPEDAPDPVVDAETVWAWQADARAALAKPAEKAGARC